MHILHKSYKCFFFKDNMLSYVLTPNPILENSRALLLMYTHYYKACLSPRPAPAEMMMISFWKVKATLSGEGAGASPGVEDPLASP